MNDKNNDMFAVSAQIGAYIASAPVIRFSENELTQMRKSFTDEDMEQLRLSGYMPCDFETFCVIRELCERLDLYSKATPEYIDALFRNGRKLCAKEFSEDPYLKNIRIKDSKLNNILLTEAEYEKGELFQYDMPDLDSEIPVIKIGYFDDSLRFPALYEGIMPWVSVCPSELNSMRKYIDEAAGRVLVLGLGLGYYTHAVSLKENVKKITVIELNGDIIDIFKKNLLPQFGNKDKIEIIKADATEYIANLPCGEYDYCFADIWEGVGDGAELYKKIKPHERRLCATRFGYWIEEQIKSYIRQTE